MKDPIRKEILYVLSHAQEILQSKDGGDGEHLKELSDHAIEEVAAYKDMDLVSISVLIYSIYKILSDIKPEDYQDLIKELGNAQQNLEKSQFGRYNANIKTLFDLVRKSNAKVKTHLQDVMQAARIKKSAVLLHHGLSIGQAAGLMGLSNWDLQPYIGRTISQEQHHEKIPAVQRLGTALKMFGVKA